MLSFWAFPFFLGQSLLLHLPTANKPAEFSDVGKAPLLSLSGMSEICGGRSCPHGQLSCLHGFPERLTLSQASGRPWAGVTSRQDHPPKPYGAEGNLQKRRSGVLLDTEW